MKRSKIVVRPMLTDINAMLRVTPWKDKPWRPCVFICSPFGGDVAGNTEKARTYMRFAIQMNTTPIAPHLLYPQVLDDTASDQRDVGIGFGLVWLNKCREVWVFGNHISEGMRREIFHAKKRRIPVRYFTENCEETQHE